MADRLVIPFTGEGSGAAGLSWGQQTVWRGIEARGAPIIITGLKALPEGTSVEDVADDLGYLMSRHQSLRTRFRPGDDGELQQVVAGSGEISLAIIDAGDDADPRKVAAAIEKEYEFADRDYANDWPIRMAVIRHRGVAVYRVTAMCHLSTDGFGALVMLRDLAGRDRVSAPGPVTAMEALEQARWQRSPAGQRQNAAAQRYWAQLLRTIPARRFPGSAGRRTPRYWEANFSSPAAYLAIQAIAARTGVDTSPVLLAAFAAALARVSGINPAVPRVMVNNRFRPRFARTVSPVAQTCPCVIDVADVTFDEAVMRAWRSSLGAFKNAYFEPARIREILAAVGSERGEEIDLGCVYNDRRLGSPREVTISPPAPQDLDAAAPRTTLYWGDQTDEHSDTCHIHIIDSPDSVSVIVQFDTHYVSPADIEAILRGVEAVTAGAAFDPNASTGVSGRS